MRLTIEARNVLKAVPGPPSSFSVYPGNRGHETYKYLWRKGLIELSEPRGPFGYVDVTLTLRGIEEQAK
jgi:hypothetical protein